MQTLELLAPARNLECGMAAIDHGADAVYIGASRFGARAAAGNSVEDIERLCRYAHQFQARVYVTVNTILYDDELEATQQLISQLAEVGVDAILVQDMGILQMPLPPIALHASTQTDNRTVRKVRWLRSIGFRRVVLARELSVDEIAQIHREVPDVELEVFVHGALCVSYSGLCYASQYCFQRSANRGECAQLCRMKFDLIDADGRELEHQRYLLSLRDMNRLGHLEELAEAGACSFKIEGRLKDVGYVKNVVAAYSQQLDAIVARHPDRYCRASLGRVSYTFQPDLRKTFNRGFTTYFLHGRQPDIFSPDTPKAMGEFVGTVKELRRDSFNVAGTAIFANGDGLCFINDDRQLEGFRVNRVQGNRLFPHEMPRRLRPGMALYRNNDQAFERLLSRPTAQRRIPLTLHLAATPDGFSLRAAVSCANSAGSCANSAGSCANSAGSCANSAGVSVSVACQHQQAAKPQHDNIVAQLSRMGGTVYECAAVNFSPGFTYFVPNSVLGELRRRLVSALADVSTPITLNTPITLSTPITPTDAYAYPYLYNISNRLSQAFYHAPGLTAYELQGGDGPLMQCRHCLRYALGYCVRHGGHRPEWREPLSLRLADGRLFRLEFDCKNCQMNIFER